MSKLVKKFLGTAGIQLVSKVLLATSGVIFARYLGVEQYGHYSFILSLIAILTIPVVAGLPTLLVRNVANYHLENKIDLLLGIVRWSRYYVLLISVTIISLVSACLYFDFVYFEFSSYFLIALFLIPLRGVLSQQGAILNGFRKPILAQVPPLLLTPLLTLLITSVFIFLGISITLEKLIVASTFSALISVFLSGLLLNITINNELEAARPEYIAKSWCISLIPFTIMTVVATLNIELASVFLGTLANIESVAYFKVAMQAVVLISLGLSSVNTVIMPDIARYYKKGDLDKSQALLTKSVRLSAIISLPIIITLLFFGDFLIKILFGNEYIDSYPILVVLCFGQLINVLMGSVTLVLNMTGNERSSLRILLFVFCVNVISLAALIPLYNGIGAAVSVSGSLILLNVLMAIKARRVTKLRTWIR